MNSLIELIKKTWHDPVWSKVISFVILSGIGSTFIFLKGWWPITKENMPLLYLFLTKNNNIPNWTLILVYTLIVIESGFIGRKIYIGYNRKIRMCTWKNYTTDTFFGLKWH